MPDELFRVFDFYGGRWLVHIDCEGHLKNCPARGLQDWTERATDRKSTSADVDLGVGDVAAN